MSAAIAARGLKEKLTKLLSSDYKVKEREMMLTDVRSNYNAFLRIMKDDSQDIEELSLFELSKMLAALCIRENDENKRVKRTKSLFLDFFMDHFENFVQSEELLREIPWIEFYMKMLCQDNLNGIDGRFYSLFQKCCETTNFCLVDSERIRKLWIVVSTYVSQHTSDDDQIITPYFRLFYLLVEQVSYVFEEPRKLVKDVIKLVFAVNQNKSGGRRVQQIHDFVSSVQLLEVVTRKFGIQERALILDKVIPFVSDINLKINVQNSMETQWELLDNIITIAVLDKRVVSRQQYHPSIVNLVNNAVEMALKETYTRCSQNGFTLRDKVKDMISRWLVAQILLRKDLTRKEGRVDFLTLFEDATCMSAVHKEDLTVVKLRLIQAVLSSNRLSFSTMETLMLVVWQKRSQFSSSRSRIHVYPMLTGYLQHCLALKRSPSIEKDCLWDWLDTRMDQMSEQAADLLHVALSVWNLQDEVVKLVCNVINRFSSESYAAVRLCSVMVAGCEFDERMKITSLSGEDGDRWRFRKDIIKWLMADLHVHSDKLLRELCRYTPRNAYSSPSRSHESEMVKQLEKLGLVARRTLKKEVEENDQQPSECIPELEEFVQEELKRIAEENEEGSSNEAKCILSLRQGVLPADPKQAFEVALEFLAVRQPGVIGNIPQSLIEELLNRCTSDKNLSEAARKWPAFGDLVANFILKKVVDVDSKDIIDIISKYEKYGRLLSPVKSTIIHKTICNSLTYLSSAGFMSVQLAQTLTSRSLSILMQTGALCKKPSLIKKVDARIVSLNLEYVPCSRNLIQHLLKQTSRTPYLCQAVVRHVLMSQTSWQLHPMVLNFVLKSKRLTLICLNHVANFVNYLNYYSVSLFVSEKVSFVSLTGIIDTASIERCKTLPLDQRDFITSLGSENWQVIAEEFWRLFIEKPHKMFETMMVWAIGQTSTGTHHRSVQLVKFIMSKRVPLNDVINQLFSVLIRNLMVILNSSEREESDELEQKAREFLLSDCTKIPWNVMGSSDFYTHLNTMISSNPSSTDNQKLAAFLSDVWFTLPHLRPELVQIAAKNSEKKPWKEFPYITHTAPHFSTFTQRLLNFAMMSLLRLQDHKKSRKTHNLYAPYVYLVLTATKQEVHDQKFIDILRNTQNKDSSNPMFDLVLFCRRVMIVMGTRSKITPIVSVTMDIAFVHPDVCTILAPLLAHLATRFQECHLGVMTLICKYSAKTKDRRMTRTCAECVDACGTNVWSYLEDMEQQSLDETLMAEAARQFLNAGMTHYAFFFANILFDRLSHSQRGTWMLSRTRLDVERGGSTILNLLKDIYIREGNADALAGNYYYLSNDAVAQTIVWRTKTDWENILHSGKCSPEAEAEAARMISFNENTAKIGSWTFQDRLLRGKFDVYPKKLDDFSKLAYFHAYHAPSEATLSRMMKEMRKILSESCRDENLDVASLISSYRQIAVIREEATALSMDEKVAKVVVSIRRLSQKSSGEKHKSLVHTTCDIARSLADMNGYAAAVNLLNYFTTDVGSLVSDDDRILIEICKQTLKIKQGDMMEAEAQLTIIKQSMKEMGIESRVELLLALATIASVHRSNLGFATSILQRACNESIDMDNIQLSLRLQFELYHVAEERLSRLETYKGSRSYIMKKDAVDAYEAQLKAESKSLRSTQPEAKRMRNNVEREAKCEKEELQKTAEDLDSAAAAYVTAATNILATLRRVASSEASPRSSKVIFSLIDNMFKYDGQPDVIAVMNAYVNTGFDSKMWLPAASHVASGCFSSKNKESPMSAVFRKMLRGLVVDYPYHTLHTVFLHESDRTKSNEVRKFLGMCLRDAQANGFDNQALSGVIDRLRTAHVAYREIVMLETDKLTSLQVDGKLMFRFPSNLRLLSLELDKIPLPFVTQAVGQPGVYQPDALIRWTKPRLEFQKADGLTTPKIWEVRATDGRLYKSVWKSEDVRQDLLVEQMFIVMSKMLGGDKLRTYNVVPIDNNTGILEFCEKTVSLKDLLCTGKVAQQLAPRRPPNEWSVRMCQVKMKDVQTSKSEEKRRVFYDICDNFKPVFRHYFYESASNVVEWRSTLKNYRESLAVWSIVCFVIGLGDRHASNILFDQEKGTFVHIDLGMILEYSKRRLPIPEQVPFRLTRDLADPILMEDIQTGQLATLCEKTIDVLKENHTVLLGLASTILRETMTSFRDSIEAGDRPSYISEMAIGRLRDKLKGVGNDGVTTKSSQIQVKRLLAEATNADRLATMFAGWMPFL